MQLTDEGIRTAASSRRSQEDRRIARCTPAPLRESGGSRRDLKHLLTLAFIACVLSACGESQRGRSTAAHGAAETEQSRRVIEFQFLRHESLDGLTHAEARGVDDFYTADGWRRVELKDLPKTLNELGALGWEILTWGQGGMLLRRAATGAERAAVEYHAIAHRFHGQEGWELDFPESQAEGEEGGWNYIDPAKGNIHRALNALGAQGWDVAVWQQDYFIILRRPRKA